MTANDDAAPAADYTLDRGLAGKPRLDLQSELLAPTTTKLLADSGLQRGDTCIDVGCGGGHTTRLLAHLVGDQGRVVGIDADASIIELARRDATLAGLTNIEFHVSDALEFDGRGFDHAYSRFLLSHLANPHLALLRILSYLRVGGRIAIEDLDVSGVFSYPHIDVVADAIRLYERVVHRGGGDARLARRLPLLAFEAGLHDVQWRYHQPVLAGGRYKHLPADTIQQLKNAAVAYGLEDAATVDSMVAELRAFIDAPATLLSLPRLVGIWGTKRAMI